MSSSRFPPNFEQWPREDQVSLITLRYNGAGLIDAVLSQAGVDTRERSFERDTFLTKNDLANIYLHMEGYDR